jgi:hypothetical protein
MKGSSRADIGFYAGKGPTPGDDVMSPEIVAEGLKHFRKTALVVKI